MSIQSTPGFDPVAQAEQAMHQEAANLATDIQNVINTGVKNPQDLVNNAAFKRFQQDLQKYISAYDTINFANQYGSGFEKIEASEFMSNVANQPVINDVTEAGLGDFSFDNTAYDADNLASLLSAELNEGGQSFLNGMISDLNSFGPTKK